MDKRRAARGRVEDRPEAASPEEGTVNEAAAQVEVAERHLLDDLRRLQAEFDNYRKRVLKEQTAVTTRASARLVERLLPVLDNFERALEHGEGGPGVELVLKEFKQVLEQEGLEEIEAEGAPFDPRLHDAFQVIEDPDVSEPIVQTVYRRGYRLGDAILRAPMVVVAQPADGEEDRGAGEPSEATVAPNGASEG